MSHEPKFLLLTLSSPGFTTLLLNFCSVLCIWTWNSSSTFSPFVMTKCSWINCCFSSWIPACKLFWSLLIMVTYKSQMSHNCCWTLATELNRPNVPQGLWDWRLSYKGYGKCILWLIMRGEEDALISWVPWPCLLPASGVWAAAT